MKTFQINLFVFVYIIYIDITSIIATKCNACSWDTLHSQCSINLDFKYDCNTIFKNFNQCLMIRDGTNYYQSCDDRLQNGTQYIDYIYFPSNKIDGYFNYYFFKKTVDVIVCDEDYCNNIDKSNFDTVFTQYQSDTTSLPNTYISPCSSNPCLNRGICTDYSGNSYSCFCQIGFYGQQCEYSISSTTSTTSKITKESLTIQPQNCFNYVNVNGSAPKRGNQNGQIFTISTKDIASITVYYGEFVNGLVFDLINFTNQSYGKLIENFIKIDLINKTIIGFSLKIGNTIDALEFQLKDNILSETNKTGFIGGNGGTIFACDGITSCDNELLPKNIFDFKINEIEIYEYVSIHLLNLIKFSYSYKMCIDQTSTLSTSTKTSSTLAIAIAVPITIIVIALIITIITIILMKYKKIGCFKTKESSHGIYIEDSNIYSSKNKKYIDKSESNLNNNYVSQSDRYLVPVNTTTNPNDLDNINIDFNSNPHNFEINDPNKNFDDEQHNYYDIQHYVNESQKIN